MNDKDIRRVEILAWIVAMPINYFIFGLYIAIVVAVSMFILDKIVNKINGWK